MQLPVVAVVLHEADASSPVQTLKSTSPVQVGFFFLRLKARGELEVESLVAAHDGTHSLDLVRAGSYPLPAESNLVLAWKFVH